MITDSGIEIIYNEIGNVLIKVDLTKNIEKNTGYLLYENILNALGDADIVTCNEINGNEPDMLIDSDRNIFLLQDKEMSDLETNGETELVKQGTLRDFIDLKSEIHVEFLKWYYSYDTAEEAINAMQTELCK